MTRGLLIGALAALAGLTGCEVSVVPYCDEYPDDPSCLVWDPSGNEISIGTSGPWTINGEVANADNCAAAGISYVEVRLYQNATGSDYYTTPAFRVACADAAFDTRPNLVLNRGAYWSQWFALDSAGNDIGAMSSRLEFNTTALAVGSHAQLLPPDYVVDLTTTIVANLYFGVGAAGTAGGCADAGVATMSYTLNDSASAVVAMETDIPCGGQLTISDVNPDTYSLYVEGATVDGLKDWMGTCTGLTASSGTSMYDCTFDYAGPSTLQLALGWDTDPGPTMTDGDCATAGVDVMSYQLRVTGAMSNTAEEYDVACADGLRFRDLAPGSYDFYVEGGTMAVKSWMMSCNMLIVDAGNVESYTCSIDKVM